MHSRRMSHVLAAYGSGLLRQLAAAGSGLLLFAGMAGAQAITGKITDAESGQPLA